MNLTDAVSVLRRQHPDLFELSAFVAPAQGQLVSWRLQALAKRVGIAAIEGKRLDCDALLVHGDDGLRVWLNEAHPISVRNFSLAHEVAHALLGVPHDLTKRNTRLEQACNQLAAELVVPEAAVREYAAAKPPSPSTLFSVAFKFSVSKSVIASRLAAIWTAAILRWEANDSELLLTYWWKPPKVALQVPSSAVAPRDSLPYAALIRGHAGPAPTELCLGSLAGQYYCEAARIQGLLVNGRSAPPAVWHIVQLSPRPQSSTH